MPVQPDLVATLVAVGQNCPQPAIQPRLSLRNPGKQLFYFEHPHPLLVEILWGWALQGHSGRALWGHSGVGHSREKIGVGHSRETLGLGLWGWALQGDSAVGRRTLQGDFGVGHSRETLGLGTPGRFWEWALQGDSGVGHSERLWVWARRRVPGEEKS